MRVYHKSDAGAPELHEGGPWFFEPENYDAGEVYSEGYATREEAEAAAAAWERTQEFEEWAEAEQRTQ